MMKNNLLLDTLHAVEQVEVSFGQTLQMISEINHRYELVSTLKSRPATGQDWYERQIQAAITDDTCTKAPSKKYKKKKNPPIKRTKKWRKVSASCESLNERDDCLEETTPVAYPPEETSASQMAIPYPPMCTQNCCQFYHIECNCNIVVPKTRTTYKERIERLHRAAQQKLQQQQCETFSNQCVNPETEPEPDPEADENCTRNWCSYCCRSCSCNNCEC